VSSRSAQFVLKALDSGDEALVDLSDVRLDDLDVGEIRLAPPPLLAKGRVTAWDGSPIAGAIVQLLLRDPAVGGATAPLGYGVVEWEEEPGCVARTNADGRFELRGDARSRPTALSVTALHFASNERLPFTPGQHGVDVVLPRASILRGRIALDRVELGEQLLLRVTSSNGSTASTRCQADGRFVFRDPPKFPLDLELQVAGEDDPFQVVEAIESPDDPRWREIPLAPRARCIDVDVVSAAGQPLGRFEATQLLPNGSERELKGRAGRVTLVTSREYVALRIRAAGHGSAELSDVCESRVVTLPRALQIRLVVPSELAPRNDALGFNVLLRSADDPKAPWTRGHWRLGGPNEVSVPSAGSWLLSWSACNTTTGRSHALSTEPIEVTDCDATDATLNVTAEALRAAWEKVR